jgi:6,7-dimethyl-8-ribityllumazine synthase
VSTSDPDTKRAPSPIDRLDSSGGTFAIVAARFNQRIVDRLVEGALAVFEKTGTAGSDVSVLRVPGAFELPLAVSRLARSGRYDGIVALGCVIRGETPHFDHVARAAADGLEKVAVDTGVPVGFGVLTTETVAQAWARAGGDTRDLASNRGGDAALAAIEMVSLLGEI